VKAQSLELIRRRYSDFGPTLAHEKLSDVHHLTLRGHFYLAEQGDISIWA
jgi:hypothetical protein